MRRTSIALLVSMFISGSEAQQTPTPPVNVAWGLYRGCILGTLNSSRPSTNAEIDKFVVDLDDYCLQWTVIWYSTQRDPIARWAPEKHLYFNERRLGMMAALRKQLLVLKPK